MCQFGARLLVVRIACSVQPFAFLARLRKGCGRTVHHDRSIRRCLTTENPTARRRHEHIGHPSSRQPLLAALPRWRPSRLQTTDRHGRTTTAMTRLRRSLLLRPPPRARFVGISERVFPLWWASWLHPCRNGLRSLVQSIRCKCIV